MTVFIRPGEMIRAIEATGTDVGDALKRQYAEPLLYLLDSAGARFGYRFEWDPFGPHSPELAEDIADLNTRDLSDDVELARETKTAADRVRDVIAAAPTQLENSTSTWVQLLAAVDFLQTRAGLKLTNGDRPPYIELNFEDDVVAVAKERIGSLHHGG